MERMASSTVHAGAAAGLSISTRGRGRAWGLWIGWALSVLVALLLVMGGAMGLAHPPAVLEGFQKYGYPSSAIVPVALAELSCAVLYLIPQTSVLGAILLTGYLGGAVSTHVRASEGFVPAVVVGVVAWFALFLREPRLRALTPLRGDAGSGSSEP